jgi:hypothetical protein
MEIDDVADIVLDQRWTARNFKQAGFGHFAFSSRRVVRSCIFSSDLMYLVQIHRQFFGAPEAAPGEMIDRACPAAAISLN